MKDRTRLAAATHHELNELERAANHAHGLVRGPPHGGIGWLLAQPTVAALALADGDAARAQLVVDRAAAEYAERGFGWAPATARLAAVRAQLSSSAAALG
ncbi:MAG: hypothetical protein ABR571_04670 [Jatrophihabitans sp.]|uniref:hypothetical protein n=1 Tax=Jatrophihabitans sp. TaxID=1932789 RepID=UPI00390CF59C